MRMNAAQLKAFDEANQQSAPSPTAKIEFLGDNEDDESAAAVGVGGNLGVVWGVVGLSVGLSVVEAAWSL